VTLVLAHAGHWLMNIGFAAPPLMVIGGVVAMVLRERRRDQNTASS
jgi:hypothetical protein